APTPEPSGLRWRQVRTTWAGEGVSYRARWLHEQVFARVLAAEDHVVDLAQVGQHAPAGVADRALQVLAHLAQRVGERALDRLEDAAALDVLVLALVEVAGRAVVLLEQLAVDLHRLPGALV